MSMNVTLSHTPTITIRGRQCYHTWVFPLDLAFWPLIILRQYLGVLANMLKFLHWLSEVWRQIGSELWSHCHTTPALSLKLMCVCLTKHMDYGEQSLNNETDTK